MDCILNSTGFYDKVFGETVGSDCDEIFLQGLEPSPGF